MTEDIEFARDSRRVTLIGAALDALLGFLKILVGLSANSASLVADGIHSLSDLVTDFIVLVTTRFSRSSPDKNHPYGHARFETLATVLLGGILLAVSIALAYENIERFINSDELLIPTWPALLIALISIGSKEWIYRYTARVAKIHRSDLLMANAWHSRSDALSSVVVLIGVGGSMLGLAWMDVAAAIVVAIIIARIALKFIWQSVRQLVDTGLPDDQLGEISKLALQVEGVLNVHDIRSRLMGSLVHIEIHIQVDAWLSVSEGHFIGNQVSKTLQENLPEISDIVFHIDTEHSDDDDYSALPGRVEITRILLDQIPQLETRVSWDRTRLHYVNGKVAIELFLQNPDSEAALEIEQKSQEFLADAPWLESIHFWR